MTEDIGSKDFKQKVLDAQRPVLVDFYATWCGPCKMLSPTVDEVAKELSDKADVYRLDVDKSPDIAGQYGVMSVPTLIVFKDGKPARTSVGAVPKQNVLDLFE